VCAFFAGFRIKNKLNYRQHLRAYNPVARRRGLYDAETQEYGLDLGRTRVPFLAVIRENASLSYESNLIFYDDRYLQHSTELFRNEVGKMGPSSRPLISPRKTLVYTSLIDMILTIDFWLHGYQGASRRIRNVGYSPHEDVI